ncbi:MAG: Outer membrane protein-like protein [Hydrogenibacillus schlegelii]|uniref:Outer membrane protein-like protein n=1 Tax=Hydrogenibacillus schlegelii TaxID=1484 RepID=A0A2T5GCA1_HYDSH|nr:TolC family protein [Hydrogenibacillus schlegelii]PTQ53812.1 MAG: Outer membrane protein-like protein [Hydrogenibacillus schlegelii]
MIPCAGPSWKRKAVVGLVTLGLVSAPLPLPFFADAPLPIGAHARAAAEESVFRSLTLQQAIDRAIFIDRNKRILEYALKNLDLNKKDLEDARDDLDDARAELNNAINAQWSMILNYAEAARQGKATDPPIDVLDRQLQEMEKQRDNLDYQKDTLDETLDELKLQRKKLELQDAELREAITLAVTQLYTGLLSLNDNIRLLEDNLDQKKKDLAAVTAKENIGMASKEEIDKKEREVTDAERTLSNVRIQYHKLLGQFLYLLDIPFNPDIRLEPVSLPGAATVNMPGDVEALAAQTFKMQQAELDRRLAKQQYDFAKEQERKNNPEYYNRDKDRYTTKKKQAENEWLSKDEQWQNTRRDVLTAIENLYREAKDAEEAYLRARQKWAEASRDKDSLRTRYELGFVSKHDYDAYQLAVMKAQTEMDAAKYRYFVALAKLDALKRGYVDLSGASAGASGAAS